MSQPAVHLFDVGGHGDRGNLCEREPARVAPGEEPRHGRGVRRARVRVADLGGKKLHRPLRGLRPGRAKWVLRVSIRERFAPQSTERGESDSPYPSGGIEITAVPGPTARHHDLQAGRLVKSRGEISSPNTEQGDGSHVSADVGYAQTLAGRHRRRPLRGLLPRFQAELRELLKQRVPHPERH